MTASGYIARTTGRTGEPRIITSAHPTREDAARAAFDADPKARSCTTCRARHGRETHADIQVHSRWSVTPAPRTGGTVR